LFEKNAETGELKLLQRMVNDISGVQMQEGGIAFATSTDVPRGINVKLYKPDTRAEIIKQLDAKYGVKFIDPTLKADDFTLSKGSVSVEQNNTFDSNDDDYYKITIPYSGSYEYAKTVKAYASGTYALMEFKGSGAPANVFFGVTDATNTSKDHKNPSMTGVGFTTEGNWGSIAVIKSVGGAAVTSGNGSVGKFDRGYLWGTNSGAFTGVSGLADSDTWRARTYVLLVGAVQDGANVKLEYTLYLNENGSLTELQTYTYTFENQTLNNGSIAFSPTIKRQYTTSIKLYEPDTKENLIKKLGDLYTLVNV
jgi:hypothetical protein